jgi:hypothetical protein
MMKKGQLSRKGDKMDGKSSKSLISGFVSRKNGKMSKNRRKYEKGLKNDKKKGQRG